jgi:hypothetical protein
MKSLVVPVLIALLTAANAHAQQLAIPDTATGKVLAAWFDAFNSGDHTRMAAFHDVYDPMGPTADAMALLRSQTGGFELVGINKSESRRIEFLVKERASETRVVGTFELTPTDPPRVANSSLLVVPPGGEMLGFDIDAATRERVITGAIAKLNENYVFPVTAKKMEQTFRRHQKGGEYDTVTKGDRFAALLTTHLRDVSHDKHLRVDFSPAKLPDVAAAPTAQQIEDNRKQLERANCFFPKVEILPRNIGYVKLDGFAPVNLCASTVVAAMNFVANVDAIIFDLRDNRGGDPFMVSHVASYLFDQPTHLNDLWTRSTDSTRQFWTNAQVSGKRLGTQPAFVLTSSRTFSGGEEFTYNLKTQKRATIVGETTGGGAHPVRGEKLDDRFTINVPFARAINPITKANWEGAGVEPDVNVAAADALTTAQMLAAEQLASARATSRP